MAVKNLAEIAVGAMVLAVAGGFLGYALLHAGRGSAAGYPLFAKFDRIDGLATGADVRIAGVKVGSVSQTEVDPKNFIAVVRFTVQNNIELPKDTSAEITSDGLLGSKYLSLSSGGDTAVLKPGQEITITQGSISIEQLLGKFIFSMTNAAGSKSADSGGGEAAVKPK